MPFDKELIVLAADKSMKISVEALLSRHHAMGIQFLPADRFDVFVQLNFDAGVMLRGHEFLRSQTTRYRHALMMCDWHGCGREQFTRGELEQQMEERLRGSGWGDRAAAVVIDPELEIWLWADSPHVEEVLGWRDRRPGLEEWMRSRRYLVAGQAKPVRPQQCLDEALELARKPRSSALFKAIAQRVSLRRCTDPSFTKFTACLRRWFPPTETHHG